MSLWSRKFINESEGGAPETSTFGQAFRRLRLVPRSLHTRDEISGVHPNSDKFYGIGGNVFEGVGVVYPIVARSYYQGELPLSQQPTIAKPYPWELRR